MIGIFILLLSAFNYINLTTAHSSVRNREVAVKKIFGSDRLKLILQFLAETVITALISISLALILARYALPMFNAIIAKKLELFIATQWPFIVRMLGIALCGWAYFRTISGGFYGGKTSTGSVQGEPVQERAMTVRCPESLNCIPVFNCHHVYNTYPEFLSPA